MSCVNFGAVHQLIHYIIPLYVRTKVTYGHSWQIHYVIPNQTQSLYNQAMFDVVQGDVITASIYGAGTLGTNSSIIVTKVD